MNARNLILFMFLILSTSLAAQKRAQRPRPAKQATQSAEILRPDLQQSSAVVIKNNNASVSQKQFDSAITRQDDRKVCSSMADRVSHPGSGATDVGYPNDLYSLERRKNTEETIKQGTGDVRINHPIVANGNN